MLWLAAWLSLEGTFVVGGGAKGPHAMVRDPGSDTVFAAFISNDTLFIYKAYLDLANDTVIWVKAHTYPYSNLEEVDIEVTPSYIYIAASQYLLNQYNAFLIVIDRSTWVIEGTFSVDDWSPTVNTKSVSLAVNYPCVALPTYRRVFMSYWNDSTNTVNVLIYQPSSGDTSVEVVTTVPSERKTSLAFVCDTSVTPTERRLLLAISSGTYTGVYTSTDGGLTWSYLTGFSGTNPYAFAVDKGPYAGIAYQYSGDVYVRFSDDGGASFSSYLVATDAYRPSATILRDTLWIAFLTGESPDTTYDTLHVGVRKGPIIGLTFGSIDTINTVKNVYTEWRPSIAGTFHPDEGRMVLVTWNRKIVYPRVAYNYDVVSLATAYPEIRGAAGGSSVQVYDVSGRRLPSIPWRKGVYFVVSDGKVLKVIRR